MAVKVLSNGALENSEQHVTVLVYERRKYSRVDWDFFRLPEENDAYLKLHADELMDAVRKIYLDYANDRSEFNGNGLVGQMENMQADQARQAAIAISALFDLYVCKRESSGRLS